MLTHKHNLLSVLAWDKQVSKYENIQKLPNSPEQARYFAKNQVTKFTAEYALFLQLSLATFAGILRSQVTVPNKIKTLWTLARQTTLGASAITPVGRRAREGERNKCGGNNTSGEEGKGGGEKQALWQPWVIQNNQ